MEDLISTRAVKADYLALTGNDTEVKAIAESALSDADARAVFETRVCNQGQVTRDATAPFKPEVVVVGGGIARSSELFLPMAQSLVEDLGIRIVPSTLFDEAQLTGAAAYWRDESRNGSESGGRA